MMKTAQVPVRISPEEKAALQRIADERAASLSSVVRWAIRMAVSQDAARIPAAGMKKGNATGLDNHGAALAGTNQ